MKRTTENTAISNNEAIRTPATHAQKPVGEKTKKVKGNAQVGCGNLVENAFVPKEAETKPTLNDLMARAKRIMVTKDHEGRPKTNGEQKVVIRNMEHKLGKDGGAYTAFEFKLEDGTFWPQNFSWRDDEAKGTEDDKEFAGLKAITDAIAMYNDSLGGGMYCLDALELLFTKQIKFKVFTIYATSRSGEMKLYTYFDRKKYEGRSYAETHNQIRTAEKDKQYKAWKAGTSEA